MDKGFIYIVPMKRKSEVLSATKQFAKEVGAPDAIVSDMAKEQVSQDVCNFCNTVATTLQALEEGTPWSNKAELYIKLMKEGVCKDMKEANCPLRFWDYCLERRVQIYNLTSHDHIKVHGSNPHTETFSEQGDISNLRQFRWYDWCYFRDHKAPFPYNQEVLGCVLGPAQGEGNELSQWVLKSNGNVVPRQTIWALQLAEMHSDTEKCQRDIFDALIERRWGSPMSTPNKDDADMTTDTEDNEIDDDNEMTKRHIDIEDSVDSQGTLMNQLPAYDRLLNAEIMVQAEEGQVSGKVIKQVFSPDGKVAGKYDNNPYLNSIMYEVELADGRIIEYGVNIIAENMLTQVDSDGFSLSLMEGIINYKRDDSVAIPKTDKYITTARGQRRLRKTTAGWKLFVKWRDQSESWVKLSVLKESQPMETAEFAKSRGIDDKSAFTWWAPHTLKKRNAIISAMKMRLRKTTHKYGIEIPTSVDHAMEIDRKNGNTMWKDALALEMFNVGVAFEILEEGQAAPPGWKKASGHLIWDVKMDFTRKARWVLDGHKTPDPIRSTFAGVVSFESV